jgi:simple sugar transport system permease protein
VKKSLLGLLVGFVLCLALTSLAGENPVLVAKVLFKSAFGSWDDLALTLFYTTSLIFTGLSVCVAFHAGLFNIGAEGQLTVSCLAATWIGLVFTAAFPEMTPATGFLLSIVAALSGALAGALWGFIPGYFKVKREAHEVILTMMMNFIAAGLAASFITVYDNPDSQNPESATISAAMGWMNWDPIHKIAPDTPWNFSFVVAVAAALLLGWLLYRSNWGFQLRSTGLNEEAALFNAIPAPQVKMKAMAVAGALAGGVALNEILGSQLKYRLGFSPDYGFIGIAVALLARNNPFGLLFSAFLFGALQKGAGDLDLETNAVTRDFARILQAVLILSVSAFSLWNMRGRVFAFLGKKSHVVLSAPGESQDV